VPPPLAALIGLLANRTAAPNRPPPPPPPTRSHGLTAVRVSLPQTAAQFGTRPNAAPVPTPEKAEGPKDGAPRRGLPELPAETDEPPTPEIDQMVWAELPEPMRREIWTDYKERRRAALRQQAQVRALPQPASHPFHSGALPIQSPRDSHDRSGFRAEERAASSRGLRRRRPPRSLSRPSCPRGRSRTPRWC
jgi:hypothetical protein